MAAIRTSIDKMINMNKLRTTQMEGNLSMGALPISPSQCFLPSSSSPRTNSINFNHAHSSTFTNPRHCYQASITPRTSVITSVAADSQVGTSSENTQQPPCVNFAFVSSVLLPDGTPDVHFRTACGGQKLRNIMLDTNIELYGPYSRPLLNCAGGGTCGTCIVEIVEGKELLSLRTEKEKEKLKKKPKSWRLACQATVGNAESRGLLVVQQLPEWKGHTWGYEKATNEEE